MILLYYVLSDIWVVVTAEFQVTKNKDNPDGHFPQALEIFGNAHKSQTEKVCGYS